MTKRLTSASATTPKPASYGRRQKPGRMGMAEPSIHPVFVGAPEDNPAFKGNHKQRRIAVLVERRQAKRSARTVQIPLTEELVPPGSELSPDQLERIRNGDYALARYLPPGFGENHKPPATAHAARRFAKRHPMCGKLLVLEDGRTIPDTTCERLPEHTGECSYRNQKTGRQVIVPCR